MTDRDWKTDGELRPKLGHQKWRRETNKERKEEEEEEEEANSSTPCAYAGEEKKEKKRKKKEAGSPPKTQWLCVVLFTCHHLGDMLEVNTSLLG